MNTQLLQATPEGIREAARLLQAGELVAIPTETVYGLAADGLNGAAVAAIFGAKQRPMDNPLILHIADERDWAPLVREIPDNARKLADAYWPGPLTMILPAADCVPDEARGGLSTVAVRFPAHPVAQAVILQAGCPLAAPSANLSGSPSPTNAARVTNFTHFMLSKKRLIVELCTKGRGRYAHFLGKRILRVSTLFNSAKEFHITKRHFFHLLRLEFLNP